MTQLTKLAQLNTNGVQNQDLTTLEIVGDSFTFGGISGTNVTKTIVDLLIANTHAPMSDNQNVVAGNGLTGGGSGSTVNLAVQATDASLTVAAGGVSVKLYNAGGIQLGGSGLFLGVDNSTIELSGNALQVKDSGITNAKVAAGIDATKIGTGTVSNTVFGYLANVTSDIQTQLNAKVPQTRNVNTSAPLAGGGALSSDLTLSITQASTSTNGYLSSTDWNTFNNKEPAITPAATTTYWRGDKTFVTLDTSVVPENGNLYYLDSRARAALSVTAGSGLSYVSGTGVFTLQQSDATHNGYLSSTDWSTFNNKQPAGNYVTALTGDVTGSGPGSTATTIAVGVVSNTKLAVMAAGTVKANVTGGSASPTDVALGTVTESTSSVLTLTGWTNATLGSPTIQVKQSSGSQSGYLSSTDWTTFNGKVSASRLINTTAPLTGGGDLSADLTIAMPAATTSVNGYLTSTDWNTFNNKQPAGNYITALTGDVTAAGPGSSAATVAFVGGASAANVASATTLALAATDANTNNAIVKRDASGNFSASTVTANLKGNVLNTLVAGETFAANTSFLVRWAVSGETAGRVYKADSGSAASQGKFYAFGIALSTSLVSAGGSIDVIELGTSTLGSSDTPFGGTDIGKAVYLTTSGAFSVTPPSTSAAAVFRIGTVRSTTQIYVGMQQLNGINP